MFRGKENFNHQYVIASCSWTFLNSLDRVSNSPLCRNWIGCRCVLFFSFVLWRSIVLYVNQFCQLVVQVDGWNSCWILLDKKREVEKRKIERNLSSRAMQQGSSSDILILMSGDQTKIGFIDQGRMITVRRNQLNERDSSAMITSQTD